MHGHRGLVRLLLVTQVACVRAARPPPLVEAVEVAAAASSVRARELAPQAHAHAEALRREAQQAYTEGRKEHASLLAERSVAAYEHAWVLSRLATAEQRRLKASAQLGAQEPEVQRLQGQLAALQQRAESLRLRGQAEAALAADSAEVDRGGPRPLLADGARALLAQARVLCACLRLAEPRRSLSGLYERIDAAAAEVATSAATAVRVAGAARAACETALVQLAGESSGRAELRNDQLLAALSRAELEPSQDARGVSVTLEAGAPEAVFRPALEAIAQVAVAHPRFSLLLVGHAGAEEERSDVAATTERLRGRLLGLGVSAVDAMALGRELPLAPPAYPGARPVNRRIEVVFVFGKDG